MRPTVYVAANYGHDRGRAAEVAAELESAGYSIVNKWWLSEETDLQAVAIQDYNSMVRYADMLVVVMEQERPWQGVWVEIGMALALPIPVYVLGDAGSSCVFMHHPDVHRAALVHGHLHVVNV